MIQQKEGRSGPAREASLSTRCTQLLVRCIFLLLLLTVPHQVVCWSKLPLQPNTLSRRDALFYFANLASVSSNNQARVLQEGNGVSLPETHCSCVHCIFAKNRNNFANLQSQVFYSTKFKPSSSRSHLVLLSPEFVEKKSI